MAKIGLINELKEQLAEERAVYDQLDARRAVQETMAGTLKEIGRSGSLRLILDSERLILANNRRYFTNSKGMENSLDRALRQHAAAMRMIEKVRDPKAYMETNKDHSLPENRAGRGKIFPNDQARQFFSSHDKRLYNSSVEKFDDYEKRLIRCRLANIRKAKTFYIALQKKALGIERPKKKGRGMGMEP